MQPSTQTARRLRLATVLAVLCALSSALSARAGVPQFSAEEQAWIARHPVVYYAGAPDISPLEDIVEGEYRGLIAAYLEAVSKRTGLRFQLIPTETWEQSQDLFAAGKVDFFPNASPTTVRSEVNRQLHYTQAYFASPLVFVTKGEANSTFGAESLRGKRIAIRGGPDVQKTLTDLRPGVIPIEVGSPEESLQAVLSGRADASVGTESTLLPLLQRKYSRSLGVASMLNLPPYRAQMGVRASEPLLHSILEKALDSISAHESDVLYERHLSQADYGAPSIWSILHYRRTELLLATLGMILLAIFAWHARMARRRAVRSERATARFLATMSHEIRTPINAMVGSIEMLARTQLDARQRGFTEGAAFAAEALVDLLDNVLDLSKLDAGKLTLERLPTDLPRLLALAVALARPGAEEKGVSINLGMALDTDQLVVLDPTRVRQVLNNLLGNAVKFTRRGCINVDARLDRGKDAALLHVQVSDTGVGIAPEQQARLFNAYSQADESTTREFGGTGLGLTICRELVELMGGAITLQSIPGTGTTVAFTVPVGLMARSPELQAGGDGSGAASGAGADVAPASARVLVVEDHPGNRALVREQLLELGVRPTLVDSGEAALRALDSADFDMVLMDCHMPGMDGYETTRRIRARPSHGSHLPIIAISASTGAEHLQACLASGMDGVLRKPLRLEELNSTLALWPVTPDAPAGVHSAPVADAAIDHVALLREDLVGIERALHADDAAAGQHHAHRLGGAALMLGCDALAAQALGIESCWKAGARPDAEQVQALAQTLGAVGERLVKR